MASVRDRSRSESVIEKISDRELELTAIILLFLGGLLEFANQRHKQPLHLLCMQLGGGTEVVLSWYL